MPAVGGVHGQTEAVEGRLHFANSEGEVFLISGFVHRCAMFSGMDSAPSAYKMCRMEDINIPGDRPVVVREEPIELCQFLKFAGATGTGGEAKIVISQGLVSLNGEVETRKRRKLMAGDRVEFGEQRLVVRVG